MNELAYFKQNQPETKEQVKSFSQAIIEQVENGNVSALDAMKAVRRWKSVCEAIEKGIKTQYDTETGHLPKLHTEDGFLFSQKQRTKYDFSHDDEWGRLKAKLDARETFLKGLKKPTFDEDTGEIINPATTKITVYNTMELL